MIETLLSGVTATGILATVRELQKLRQSQEAHSARIEANRLRAQYIAQTSDAIDAESTEAAAATAWTDGGGEDGD